MIPQWPDGMFPFQVLFSADLKRFEDRVQQTPEKKKQKKKAGVNKLSLKQAKRTNKPDPAATEPVGEGSGALAGAKKRGANKSSGKQARQSVKAESAHPKQQAGEGAKKTLPRKGKTRAKTTMTVVPSLAVTESPAVKEESAPTKRRRVKKE